jgi:hypothetical protein
MHCRKQSIAGGERHFSRLVEAFPISHNLDSQGRISSAMKSKFDDTSSCHDGNQIVKRRDSNFRHLFSLLTDVDLLKSRTISMDVPKVDTVIHLVPLNSMLNACDLVPIGRNPSTSKHPIAIAIIWKDHFDQLCVGDRANLQSAVVAV